MHPLRTVVFALSLMLAPAAVAAKAVYLNKVRVDNVDGLRNMKLEKATVRFDEKGDIHIDAPGYQIKVMEQGGSTAPGSQTHAESTPSAQPEVAAGPAQVTQRYFLVTEQTVPGMTEFDIDVYVNSKWIRKLRNNEEQIYADITKHLVPGKNSVVLNARKISAGTRKSLSPDHVFRVIIGEGNVGGAHVMIDRPLVDFKRTAADEQNVSKEFTFVTR